MESFQLTSSFKRDSGFYKDGVGSNHPIFPYLLFESDASYVKRNESYETIGGLFAEITKNSVELSVAEKIWLLIVEVISVIAEALNCDAMALTEQVIHFTWQIYSTLLAFLRNNH